MEKESCSGWFCSASSVLIAAGGSTPIPSSTKSSLYSSLYLSVLFAHIDIYIYISSSSQPLLPVSILCSTSPSTPPLHTLSSFYTSSSCSYFFFIIYLFYSLTSDLLSTFHPELVAIATYDIKKSIYNKYCSIFYLHYIYIIHLSILLSLFLFCI